MEDLLLLIVSSPSGAGKTTLTRRLLHAFSDMMFSVSHTTRRPRTGEVDGQDYHFTARKQFLKMVVDGEFAEWAEVHSNLYGTCMSELERARRDGKRGIVFDVDYQGARQIKARLSDAVSVFILPPTMEELERRLRGRASEDPDSIARRILRAHEEIEHYSFFDYLVVNEEVDKAEAELCGVVYAERCRRWRMAARAENLLRSVHPPVSPGKD